MCGRYASYTPPDAIRRLLWAVNLARNVAPSWNVAPSQQATTVPSHPVVGEWFLDLLTLSFASYWVVDLRAEHRWYCDFLPTLPKLI